MEEQSAQRKDAVKEWPDEKAKKYLDEQFPKEKIKWIAIFETGLYGFIDSNGLEFACADDDELRSIGITEFLIRDGGSYVSNEL